MAIHTQLMPGMPTSTARPISAAKVINERRKELKAETNGLPLLDFSKFNQKGGMNELSMQAREAFESTGFFYITNFGLSEEEVKDQFSLGKKILHLPEEEKQKYCAKLEEGDYNGWRPTGAIEQFPGLRDNWEGYHIVKDREENVRTHPREVLDNETKIRNFHRFCHENIGFKVLRIIENILEIPADSLVDKHRYEDKCSSFLRYGRYHHRTPEVNAKYDNLYVREHTDFGSLTFLFSNSIAGLQLKMPDGTWKDVPHVPGSLLVITADILQFWTHGYLRSSMHRVVAPPDAQEVDRYNLIYFMRPADNTRLTSFDSPLLKRLGMNGDNESEELRDRRKGTVQDWVLKQTAKNWVPYKDQRVSGNELDDLFKRA